MSPIIHPHSPVHRLRQAGAATAHSPLSARDCAVLDFLWRWKVATTATLHAATRGTRTAVATYQALMRLSRLKLIECQLDKRSCYHYWTLTKTGYNVVRESLGELKEVGFKSENIWHDLNVVAFHLGHWVSYSGDRVEFFTEQELRRRGRDYYPEWVPNTGESRSDGYTRIHSDQGRSWTLAYEVELSAKSLDRYESVIRTYRMYREVDLVLWMVGSSEIMAQIIRAKSQARDPEDRYHLFVDHEEYQRAGWGAQAVNAQGQVVFTFHDFVRGLLGDLPSTCPSIAKECHPILPQFNPRKALRREVKTSAADLAAS